MSNKLKMTCECCNEELGNCYAENIDTHLVKGSLIFVCPDCETEVSKDDLRDKAGDERYHSDKEENI